NNSRYNRTHSRISSPPGLTATTIPEQATTESQSCSSQHSPVRSDSFSPCLATQGLALTGILPSNLRYSSSGRLRRNRSSHRSEKRLNSPSGKRPSDEDRARSPAVKSYSSVSEHSLSPSAPTRYRQSSGRSQLLSSAYCSHTKLK